MASNSASTAKTNTSMSAKLFQPSPRPGRGTGRAEGGRRSAAFGQLARDIDLRWSAQTASTIYVSEPIRLPRLISRTDSNKDGVGVHSSAPDLEHVGL
jgi:hypothetical protein